MDDQEMEMENEGGIQQKTQHSENVGAQTAKKEETSAQSVVTAAKRHVDVDYNLHGFYYTDQKIATFSDDDADGFGETGQRVRLDLVTKLQLTEIRTRTPSDVRATTIVGGLPIRQVRVDEQGHSITAQGERYCSAIGKYEAGKFCRVTAFGPNGDLIEALLNNPKVHYVTILGENLASRTARAALFNKQINPVDMRAYQGVPSLRVVELVAVYKDGSKEKLIHQPNMILEEPV